MVPKLLFIPRHETSWSKMKIIIESVKKNFNCEILISSKKMDQLIENNYKKIRITNYKKRNFFYIFFNRIEIFFNKSSELSNFFFFGILRIFITSVIYKFETKFFIKQLKILSPDLILLPGDRELSPILTISKAAKVLKIPSVICVTSIPDPICLHTQRAKSKSFIVDIKKGGNIINKLASYFLPNQTFLNNNIKLLFSPGWRTFGLFFAGCISKKPWIQGGGNSDYVFESDLNYKRIAESFGRDKQKTIVIGDPHNEIVKKKKNIKNRHIILFCPPQDAEHNLLPWDEHIKRINKISNAIKNLKKKELVYFNLHPKANISNYNFLEKNFGFVHFKSSFSQQIPITKLLIASASSIIPLFIAGGVPVFNIDDLNFWNKKIVSINFGVKTIKSLTNIEKNLEAFYKEIDKLNFKKKLSATAQIMSERLLVEKKFEKHIVEIIIKILKKN